MNDDRQVLLLALRSVTLALDALVSECHENGAPKAPSKQAIMRARGVLPPYCAQALSKKGG